MAEYRGSSFGFRALLPCSLEARIRLLWPDGGWPSHTITHPQTAGGRQVTQTHAPGNCPWVGLFSFFFFACAAFQKPMHSSSQDQGHLISTASLLLAFFLKGRA